MWGKEVVLILFGVLGLDVVLGGALCFGLCCGLLCGIWAVLRILFCALGLVLCWEVLCVWDCVIDYCICLGRCFVYCGFGVGWVGVL